MKQCTKCNNGFIEKVCQMCNGTGKDPDPPANQPNCDCDICKGTGKHLCYCTTCHATGWIDD